MLPSTGYFKGINCPFYDTGLCERPYCHFRHVKKDSQGTSSDGMESGAILQKLVSAAVQRVLQQTEPIISTTSTQEVVVNTVADIKISSTQLAPKATYNPTPISELNKINNTDNENHDECNEQRRRHIPVPYTPRKPASIPIKRPVETNGSLFVYIPPPIKYTPGSVEGVQTDSYIPEGAVESKEKYLPGTEAERQEYTPKETNQQSSSKRNYVPSDKNISKKKILEYKPAKVTSKRETSSVTYQPTPRALAPCFSSDEDEPNYKKRKLSPDLNELDNLGAEFDILDQILDEEKSEERPIKTKTITKSDLKNSPPEIPTIKKENGLSHKTESHKNHKKKEKSASRDQKKKQESNSLNSHKKSSHKSSNKDKYHSKEEKKHSTDIKKKSSSKSSDHSSRHSKSSSSKKSEEKESKSDLKKKGRSSKSITETKKSKEKKNKKKDINSTNVSDNYDNGILSPIEEEIAISESDEETIALECKKIFEEYVPTEKIKETIKDVAIMEEKYENEYVPTKKRISRTTDKNIKITPKMPVRPDFKASAAQIMAERLTKVREYHVSRNTGNASSCDILLPKNDISKGGANTITSGNSKIRIAHVPYASTLLNAKKSISPSQSQKVTTNVPSTSTTAIQTVKKGTQRVAHIPNEKFIDRPGVLEPLASKIPANIRSTYLNMMIDECLKIYLSATDAYARAQHEELTTSKKCSTVQIYKNSAVLTVSRLRKEFQECNGVKKSGLNCVALQKIPQAISGQTSNTGSWSIESKYRKSTDHSNEFSGAKLYNNIKKWILSEEQLKENGFPRPHDSREKGRAIIYGQNKQKPPKGFIRTCCRCKKDYTVDKKGFPAVKQECIYHPNNKYRVRGEARYQCCSQDASSDGCCIAPNHVYEYVDFENLKGFVKTLPPETKTDDYGVYSLDCEMCYTTHGLDLTRVTVIDSSCKVVYETLIKPLHPIIDYNTRYSGITEEHMVNVKTTLLEVQATLLAMFNSKTILIGHSLESDFKALKFIHETVIDTSVLFPHKMGPPYKRALRNLSSEYLKKIIQNSVDGHDSAEDATVCMELIHFKLKEDLKTR